MKPEELVEKLRLIYQEELESVILFGSAAGQDFHHRHSDFNLLIVLKEISLPTLSKSAPLCQKWTRDGHPMPLFLTSNHLENSRDVFPIEFLDIKELHRVLYGPDPFKELVIANTHLRLQCESELRGKLIKLRAEYLRLTPNAKKLQELIRRSSSSFFAIFRGLLRLLGESVPTTRREVLQKLNQKTKVDTSVFDKILAIREGSYKLAKQETESLMEQYLTTLEKVTSYVDNL